MDQREKQKERGKEEIYYKELAYVIMETGQSKIFCVHHQAGDPGETTVHFQYKDRQAETQESGWCR